LSQILEVYSVVNHSKIILNSTKPIKAIYLASSLLGKVSLDSGWLEAPVPLERTPSQQNEKPNWTYKQYFETINNILSRDSYGLLLEAIQKQLAVPLVLADLQELRIYAEKHGHFYHPAKIEVKTLKGMARFALNAALTERGVEVMDREVRSLKHLEVNYPYHWLPKVYFLAYFGKDSKSLGIQRHRLSLFLADWLEGFHEFHLSLDPEDGIRKIILWDGNPKATYLSLKQTGQVYEQVSLILTHYYNPRTYEQIHPWHHGAGDFVVKINREEIEVRLVTVRQYGALVNPDLMPVQEACLFFFLNLSIRTRLDRLDGVGDLVWAEEDCLERTWFGFLEGLKLKEKESILGSGFVHSLMDWMKALSLSDLAERFSALLESYDLGTPDLPIIKGNIAPHILGIYNLIQRA
jgi:hypothetical protein